MENFPVRSSGFLSTTILRLSPVEIAVANLQETEPLQAGISEKEISGKNFLTPSDVCLMSDTN